MAKMSAVSVGKIKETGYHRDNGDGGARGLYLQVSPATGGGLSKSWIYRYVSPVTGKPRWMGLGPADVIGLAKARELARTAREKVVLGDDPIEDRRTQQAARRIASARALTFGKCAADYIEQHRAGWKNPKHAAQWKSTFEGDNATTRAINDLPVAAVDTALVLKVLRPIWLKKPESAGRDRGRIERVLAWATVSEFRQGENPARWRGHLSEMLPAKSKIHKVKPHKAVPYVEVPGFMADLRDRDSVSARALEFTVLSATRTNETIGAVWDEIDMQKKVWTIPAVRMKAEREHRVPLSDRSVEILKGLPREGKYVFPGGKANKPLSNMAQLELLKGMIGNGYTVHGFRSSFRDWCKEQTNFPREIAELALAHMVADKSEAAYSRGDALDKRRLLMAAWAKYCATKPLKAASVTPIRGGMS
ncbi:site-specific integrase [Bradyrhizobium sp. OAE829]|uniref:tyrosine-type recombinase/integrase n=1 Tax=Bradyrhizobium sp. OAE829 TaxID=2663807 RepID=UPI001789FCCA